MSRRIRSVLGSAVLAALSVSIALAATPAPVRAAAPAGAIQYILVIDLENESFASTFGATSPATYLNQTLVPQGELLVNYFGTSHVSLGNYIAQVSGQGTNGSLNNDCMNLATLTAPPVLGSFNDVYPGTDTTDQASFPGQVVGTGCVFPAPAAGVRGAQTIGDQIQKAYGEPGDDSILWRAYAEDMGNDINRDWGTPDSLGIGADCAHPPINGNDYSNSAAADDQYATRHNPWVYFHSVIDTPAYCNTHVVPLGKVAVGSNGAKDVFTSRLARDLRSLDSTPKFMFVTPNLCNDGHDATCAGPNTEGTVTAAGKNIGGLVGADLWLKHWMPMILSSPAYQSGKMLVVVTFDEAAPAGPLADTRACANADQSTCLSPVGPNLTDPGFSPLLGMLHYQTNPGTTPYVYAGGGQVGAVLLNPKLIVPGTVNASVSYNHYSALRSYEDLLGLTKGGDDGQGHLGYAGTKGLQPFGKDVFNAVK